MNFSAEPQVLASLTVSLLLLLAGLLSFSTGLVLWLANTFLWVVRILGAIGCIVILVLQGVAVAAGSVEGHWMFTGAAAACVATLFQTAVLAALVQRARAADSGRPARHRKRRR